MTITTGTGSSSRNNNVNRITLQSRNRSPMQTNRFTSNRSRTNSTNSSTLDPSYYSITRDLQPIRRSRRVENGASNNNSGNSLSQSIWNQSFYFDSEFPRFQPNPTLNNRDQASEDDNSDQELGAFVSHFNRASELFEFDLGGGGDNVNESLFSNQQSIDIDNPFFMENQANVYQNSNNTNTQPFQPARSYALNIDGGDTAENALEIQDSDDEIEIADLNDEEVEILFD